MTFSELLIKYRSDHSLSQRKFAEQCNLSNGYISMLENNLNPSTGKPVIPTLPALNKIAHGMGISLDELLSMVDDNAVISLRRDPAPEESAPLPDNIIPMPVMRTVPLLGMIACGDPILAAENLDGEVSVPEHVTADFALRCKGDSMINARIHDGDIVYIRQQDSVDNGQIAAVLIGDEATLKRVNFNPASKTLILSPANDAYAPFVFVGDELDRVRILGRAVAFTSFVR